jgi:peptidoglycan hydrolase-like protein with peptidoglycan-binding domain
MAGQGSTRNTRTERRDASVDATPTRTRSTTSTEPPTSPPPSPSPPARPPRPAPSPRNGVAVNVATIQDAFLRGDASQSVGYVQHVLRSRGFDPGNVAGVPDHATRTALARFQESVGLRPTGLPDDVALDYLGFDVVA